MSSAEPYHTPCAAEVFIRMRLAERGDDDLKGDWGESFLPECDVKKGYMSQLSKDKILNRKDN